MKRNGLIGLVFTILALSVASCNQEPTVYEWRGLDRAGIYYEEGLLKSWPDNGPELIWENEEIGNGYGSPIFTDKEMYIMGEADSVISLFAFDADLELIWKKDLGIDWMTNYTGARSAPTIVDHLIYMISANGVVYCLDRNTGEKNWSVDMVNDLDGVFPLFGYSESVIIEDEKLFCTPGGKDNNVVALDRLTGDLIWASKGLGERSGYCSPQIIQLEERNVMVHFTAYELLGHDTKTGELLWSHNQDNTTKEERRPGLGDTHSNTIIYEDGYIYYAAGDGNCGVKLELSSEGKSIKEVWRNKEFDDYMGGIVKIGNYLYGGGTAKPIFSCVNAETGETEKSLRIGPGSVIAADDMLYYYNQRGDVHLITQDSTNMEVISQFKMTKGTRQHFAQPVINKGRLFVRHGQVIQAYNIKDTAE